MNPLWDTLTNRPSNQTNSNPMQNVMNLVKGRNPKDVFYEECQKRGVDPNQIINMARNFK